MRDRTMNRKRLFACLLLTLILALTVSPAAYAELQYYVGDENFTGPRDATLFQAGVSPVNSADIKGLLFLAGNDVHVTGSSEYTFIAGNTVAIDGSCLNDAFLGALQLNITGSVGRDLYAAASELTLSGSVGRDVFAVAGTVILEGEIGGNVYLEAGDIQISDSAKIAGTVYCNSEANITGPADIVESAGNFDEPAADSASAQAPEAKEAAARAHGQATVSTLSVRRDAGAQPFFALLDAAQAAGANTSKVVVQKEAASLGSRLMPLLKSYVGLLLVAFLLLWRTTLWQKIAKDFSGKKFGFYIGTFFIGVGYLLLLPLICILLIISGFGVRMGLILILVISALAVAAPVFFGFFLGSFLWCRLLKRERTYWAELLIGLLIWCLLRFVPSLQLITTVITMPLAVGVFRRLLIKKEKKKSGSKSSKSSKSKKSRKNTDDSENEEIIERSMGRRSNESDAQQQGRQELNP